MADKLPQVTAWSYSRYADYKQCPAKFKYKHLMRLPDPGSAAPDFVQGLALRRTDGLELPREEPKVLPLCKASGPTLWQPLGKASRGSSFRASVIFSTSTHRCCGAHKT